MVNRRAPPGQEFKLASGETVHTIEELLEYLNQSSDENFQKHVTEDRNDFANWIRHVHGKEDLAKELEKADTRRDAIFTIKDAVDAHYEDKKKTEKPKPRPPMKTAEVSEEQTPEEATEETVEPDAGQEKVQDNSPPRPTHSTEHGEFITKEFVYGMIFGFIIGLLAAGIFQSLI